MWIEETHQCWKSTPGIQTHKVRNFILDIHIPIIQRRELRHTYLKSIVWIQRFRKKKKKFDQFEILRLGKLPRKGWDKNPDILPSPWRYKTGMWNYNALVIKMHFKLCLISFHPDSADSWGVNCESVMLVEAKTRDAWIDHSSTPKMATQLKVGAHPLSNIFPTSSWV